MCAESASSVVKLFSMHVFRTVSCDIRQHPLRQSVSACPPHFVLGLLPEQCFLRQEIGQSLPPVSFPLMGPIKLALGQKREACQECRSLCNQRDDLLFQLDGMIWLGFQRKPVYRGRQFENYRVNQIILFICYTTNTSYIFNFRSNIKFYSVQIWHLSPIAHAPRYLISLTIIASLCLHAPVYFTDFVCKKCCVLLVIVTGFSDAR